jgi:hypothetical protein
MVATGGLPLSWAAEDDKMTVANEEDDFRGRRDRSPQFPYVGLQRAVELTAAFYAKAKKYEVALSGAAKDWQLSATSSSLGRVAAALQSFGLVELSGSGDTRRVKITEAGWRVIEDPRPEERRRLLEKAAVNPPVFAEYAEKWAGGRPDDDHAIFQLKERGFTDEGAPKFLRVFDETKRFFPTTNNDKSSASEGFKPLVETDYGGAKEGDFVQWESGGTLKFSEPKQVVSVHETGDWVFVEGSQTGIPMSEVIVQDAPEPRREPPVLDKIEKRPGEAEWLRGPLSRETSYRLLISGDMGPKEIGKLIKVLEAQKAVLSDDDNAKT